MHTPLQSLQPRTSGRFASLMELYERNYMLVRVLAPGLREMVEGQHVSTVPGTTPLVLDSIEHDRYTTTFKLTYRFSSRHRHAREPDLSIRLYHDARTCEVMSGLLPGERVAPRRTRDLDEGWRLNRFLHRWLGYCLRQGHGFEGGAADMISSRAPESGRASETATAHEMTFDSRVSSHTRVSSHASASPQASGRELDSDTGADRDTGEDCPAGDAPLQRQ